MMHYIQPLAVRLATFATNTGISEVDTAKTKVLGTIATVALIVGAWYILDNLLKKRIIAIVSSIIMVGIGLYFINDPTNAVDVIKGIYSKFTGGSM